MDFTEAQGFDADSIALHDRLEAIANSENCTYQEALTRLVNRVTPEKGPVAGYELRKTWTVFDDDRESVAMADKIRRYAKTHGLNFSQACDKIASEAAANFSDMTADESFNAVLRGV